jgi:hypothetical protein
MAKEDLKFIRQNRDHPYFLYLAFTIPDAAIQVPNDSLEEYEDAFPEKPYPGDKEYLPHPRPRAAYQDGPGDRQDNRIAGGTRASPRYDRDVLERQWADLQRPEGLGLLRKRPLAFCSWGFTIISFKHIPLLIDNFQDLSLLDHFDPS